MAYLKTLCEFYGRLRDHLPTACVLCSTRTPGGLCEHCRSAVCQSRLSGWPRCPRCDLLLGEGRVAPEAHAGLTPAAGQDPDCPDCAVAPPVLERVVAAFDYAWPGELLIQQLKLQRRISYAPVLAALLAARCTDLQGCPEARGGFWGEQPVLVMPVPSSRHSLVARGFNPAAEIGRDLAYRLRLEWRPELLRRVREGHEQKSQGRHARRQGVEGLYSCSDAVAGRDILVVDDVMTTGSTLNAIATVLKGKGAHKVWAAVAARTPLRCAGGGA
ncbi:MAG: phosphoribosyltransferase family protein [Burkholderiaceae bacterium]